MSYADMVERSGALQAAFTALAAVPKPTVAADHRLRPRGRLRARAGCDFRVCADDAKLGQPEILLGIIPGAGGTQRLSRLVGPAKAKDLIFTGRFVGADEALAIGLVDEVVAGRRRVRRRAARVARFVDGPAFALRAAKEAIDRGLEVDLATGLEIERMQFAALFATEDREIGMTSFVETARARPSSRGAEPMRRAGAAEDVERAWDGQQARPGALPRLGSADLRRRSGRSRSTSAASTTPATGSSPSPGADGLAVRQGARDRRGTGFFLLNLKQAGVLDEAHVTDLSPGMVEAAKAQRRSARLRGRGPGRRRRADPLRRRHVRPRRRARGDPPHPGCRAGAARDAAGAASRAAGSSSRASRPASATGTPGGSGRLTWAATTRRHPAAAAARAVGPGRRRSSTSRPARPRWRRSSTCTRSTPTSWPGWRCAPAPSTYGPRPRS